MFITVGNAKKLYMEETRAFVFGVKEDVVPERRTRYEQVTERINWLIQHGAFSPGSRIPSVRATAHQMDVSVTTVLEAYRRLEDQGLIEARPQSGHYVRPRFPALPSEPELLRQVLPPTRVSMGDLSMIVLSGARNPDLIPLGAAVPNPELLPVERLSRMLYSTTRRHLVQSISYDLPPGCKKLRVQVARRLFDTGCALTPDQIVATSGCMEAVILALMATCRAGGVVALESPVSFSLLQAIEILRLRALEIPTHPVEGMSIDALRYALDNHSIKACLVISNFSNPLGSLMPDDRKKELVDLLSGRDIPLIEDDTYGDLSFSPNRPKVAKAYDQKGLVILCSSFSKALAPGYRVGWMAPGRFQKEVERVKGMTTVATPAPTHLAVAGFLADGGYDHHLRAIRRIYARQVALMADAVGKHFPKGTRVSRPAGGYILWVECPEYVDALKLHERAIGAGISIAPGPIFSARGKYRNCVRLNAAFWSSGVEQAVATIGRFATEMQV